MIVALPVLAFVLCIFIHSQLPRGEGILTVLATFAGLILSIGIPEIFPKNEMFTKSIPWFATFNVEA